MENIIYFTSEERYGIGDMNKDVTAIIVEWGSGCCTLQEAAVAFCYTRRFQFTCSVVKRTKLHGLFVNLKRSSGTFWTCDFEVRLQNETSKMFFEKKATISASKWQKQELEAVYTV